MMMRRRLRTVEALLLICACAALIRLVPVRFLIPRLGRAEPCDPGSREPSVAMRSAIRSACARLPFQPTCLAQSLAAAAMLRRRNMPHRFHVGARMGGRFEAHAWVEAAGVVVAGEGDVETFAVLRPRGPALP